MFYLTAEEMCGKWTLRMKFTTLCKMAVKLDVCREVMGNRYTRFTGRTTCMRKKADNGMWSLEWECLRG